MTSIITADIINSRFSDTEHWMGILKQSLGKIGTDPQDWKIFRGDSFQVEIKDPKLALREAIKIKSNLKQIKNIDVRMCIGIGDKTYQASSITESNGTAFLHSGDGFEFFKSKKQSLGIKSSQPEFDNDVNMMLRLALIVMDSWTPVLAEYVSIALDETNLNQDKIGELLNISQSSVSERKTRSNYQEINDMISWYEQKITHFNFQ